MAAKKKYILNKFGEKVYPTQAAYREAHGKKVSKEDYDAYVKKSVGQKKLKNPLSFKDYKHLSALHGQKTTEAESLEAIMKGGIDPEKYRQDSASATVKKRKGKPPLIVPPPGPHVRRPKGWKPPPPNTRRDKALQRFLDDLLKSKNKGGKVLYRDTGGKTHAELTKDHESHKRKGKKAPPHPHVGRLGSQRIRKRIAKAAESYPLSKKRHGGGMSHVGLYPAEERGEDISRSTGTLSQAKRKRHMNKGGKVYRKLGGKVTNGNDVVRMIYEGDN